MRCLKAKPKLFFIFFLFLILLPFSYALTNIDTCLKLQAITDNLNEDYILTSDIDCTGTINWNSGKGFRPITNFTGELDGDNFTIDGLTIAQGWDSNIAMFNSSHGIIKNIVFTNHVVVQTVENRGAAGLVYANYGNISDIRLNGDISASDDEIGGLVSLHVKGNIKRVFVNASINCSSICGGIVARLGKLGDTINNPTLSECKSIGNINGSTTLGGVVGFNFDFITNCYSEMNLLISSVDDIGGFVGSNFGIIEDAYSTGDVTIKSLTASDKVGGFAGSNEAGSLITSYSTGELTILSGTTKFNGSFVGDTQLAIVACSSLNRGLPCAGNNSGFFFDCENVSVESFYFDYDNIPMLAWNYVTIWDSSLENSAHSRLLFESGIEGVISEPCPAPQLFCDDFQYSNSLTAQKNWEVFNSDASLNLTFSPANSQVANFTGKNPKSISHTIDRFTVNYPTDDGITTIQSIFAPKFSNEFDLKYFGDSRGSFIFRTFDYQFQKCYDIRFIKNITTGNILIQNLNTTTNLWDDISVITANISHTIKVVARFGNNHSVFPFNTSIAKNKLDIYSDSSLINAVSIPFSEQCDNINLPAFVKEGSSFPNVSIDNYFMYHGTDKFISTTPGDFIPVFIPVPIETINTTPAAGETLDFSISVDTLWSTFGVKSARSKIMFGLMILIIFNLILFAYMIRIMNHISVSGIIVLNILGMVMLTYLRLFPVWLLFIIGIGGAGAAAFAVRKTS